MQFSQVLYWQHDIFKGPFLINKVQNHSPDYACGVSIKRSRLWKRWIEALLVVHVFCFLSDHLEGGSGQGYFFFFSGRIKCFLAFTGPSGGKWPPWAEGRLQIPSQEWTGGPDVTCRFWFLGKVKICGWGQEGRHTQHSFQKANWESA